MRTQSANKDVNNYFSGYIINQTGSINKRIDFLWSPSSMNESISTSYDSQVIPGRTAPIITYTSTGARQLSVSIIATSDYLPSGYSTIEKYVDAFKSLAYPEYTYVGKPLNVPRAFIKVNNISMTGVVTSVNVNWDTARYTYDKSPGKADIELSFTEVISHESLIDANTILGNSTTQYISDRNYVDSIIDAWKKTNTSASSYTPFNHCVTKVLYKNTECNVYLNTYTNEYVFDYSGQFKIITDAKMLKTIQDNKQVTISFDNSTQSSKDVSPTETRLYSGATTSQKSNGNTYTFTDNAEYYSKASDMKKSEREYLKTTAIIGIKEYKTFKENNAYFIDTAIPSPITDVKLLAACKDNKEVAIKIIH